MNMLTACCGHPTIQVGSDGSAARFRCETSPCHQCSQFIHCGDHEMFVSDCHWCNVSKQAYLRMTTLEQALRRRGI